jgi:hypothetical protein
MRREKREDADRFEEQRMEIRRLEERLLQLDDDDTRRPEPTNPQTRDTRRPEPIAAAKPVPARAAAGNFQVNTLLRMYPALVCSDDFSKRICLGSRSKQEEV